MTDGWTYVFDAATGALVSEVNDGGPIAGDDELKAAGLAKVTGQPRIGDGHSWNAASRTVAPVATAAAPGPRFVETSRWIMRFTSAEFAGIVASQDPIVQQFMYALNHTEKLDVADSVMVTGVNYLASVKLLSQARVAAILA